MNEPIETKDGYAFGGWFIDEERTKRINPAGRLPATVTLYPKWIPILFPITYILNGGMNSRRNPRHVTVETGVLKLYPAFKHGQVFIGWFCNGQKVDCIQDKVSQPLVLEARFGKIPTIEFDTQGGAIIHEKQTDQLGYIETFNPPMRLGYTFEGWYLDPEFEQPWNFSIPLVENSTLYAKWKTLEYPIHFHLNGGRFIQPVKEFYTYDSGAMNLPKPIKEGCTFLGWKDPRGNLIHHIRSKSMGERILYADWQEEEIEIFRPSYKIKNSK